MKPNRHLLPVFIIALAALLLGSLLPIANVLGQDGQPLAAQDAASPDVVDTVLGSAFTYQGYLQQGGAPVDGVACDFYFALWTEITGGNQLGTLTLNGVNINEGVFTVQLDFGNVFTGDGVWLETAVQCPGDTGYTTLLPRQSITAVPYALSLRPGAVIEGDTAPFTGAVIGRTSSPDGYGLHGDSAEGYGVGGTGAVGLYGSGNTDGVGVFGTSENGTGVYASSTNATAVQAESVNDIGVSGISTTKIGVLGQSSASSYTAGEAVGVKGISTSGSGEGVYGEGYTGIYGVGETGVVAIGNGGNGVFGRGNWAGVWGSNESSAAEVYGVYGTIGNVDAGSSSAAVRGYNWGEGNSGIGVWGQQDGTGYGVYGYTPGGGYGVVGESPSPGYAGFFKGNVHVVGTLSKGAGAFKIDHPLDPANKYLSHSFVESPDMMNIYNGNIITDADGFAIVTLPDWFEALNQDFRYQLTVIGQFAQAIVAEEIEGNQFRIQTDRPLVKVSWQVTGIRHDPFAEAHRIPVEEEKTGDEKGHYLYPEVYGKRVQESIWYAASPNSQFMIDNPDAARRRYSPGEGK